jgi:hypothetical protein
LTTTISEREEAPTWSPDATWIAYAHGTAGRWTLTKAEAGTAAPPVVIKDDIVPSSRPRWSPKDDWIAYDSPAGLSIVSPDGKVARSLSEQTWFAYEWAQDLSRLFGIRTSDDGRNLVLGSVDIATGQERVKSTLGRVPLASPPVRGFTRMSNRSFATSIVRVRSDIWLLEGFHTHRSVLADSALGALAETYCLFIPSFLDNQPARA